MLYINRTEMYPLQLVLQNIINSYQATQSQNIASADALNRIKTFSMGIKMGAIVVTMLPIRCVFPFLQKFFVSGIIERDWNTYGFNSEAQTALTAIDYRSICANLVVAEGDLEENWKKVIADNAYIVDPAVEELNENFGAK